MFIKSFIEYYKINESVYDGVLYHGSPRKFLKFKDTVSFFSETKRFAIDYSEQKSMDFGLDDDANLYTVKCKTDFFDINNKKCESDLINILPDMVSFTYNNFGFSVEVPRDEIIFNMKGFYTIEPYEEAVDAKIGDIISSPEYKGDSYYVYKRDNDYLYTIDYKSLNRKLDFDQIVKGYDSVYKPIKDIIEEVAREGEIGRKYFSDSHLQVYFIVLMDKRHHSTYGVDIPSDDDINRFKQEYDKLRQNLIDKMIKDGHTKKYTLKTIIKESGDTWRYYENETVHNSLLKLGYGGYIAKEENINTYAVFNPRKDIEILEFEFPVGCKYKNKEEYDNFIEFKKKLRTFMENDGFFDRNKYAHVSGYVLYDSWKSKFSIEQTYEKINK